ANHGSRNDARLGSAPRLPHRSDVVDVYVQPRGHLAVESSSCWASAPALNGRATALLRVMLGCLGFCVNRCFDVFAPNDTRDAEAVLLLDQSRGACGADCFAVFTGIGCASNAADFVKHEKTVA